MHICFATLDYPTMNSGGGVATVTRLLAQALTAQGHQVSVIRLGEPNTPPYLDGMVKVYTIDQGPVHYYLSRLPLVGKHLGLPAREFERSLHLVRKLQSLHKQQPIDVIEFSEEGVFCSAFSPLRKQCKYITRLHGTEYAWLPKVPGKKVSWAYKAQRALQRYFFRHCPNLIAVSTFYKNLLINDLGKKHAERISVLPNPIEIDYSICQAKYEPFQTPTFLFVNRIQDIKGIDLLIRALGVLKREGVWYKLLIAGNGHPTIPKEQFQQWLGEEKIADRVEVIGHIPKTEIAVLMRRCTAVVVPSYFETFGMVGIEAISIGAKLIHTKVGIMAEAPDLPGVAIVEPDNISMLSEALLKFSKNIQTHDGVLEDSSKYDFIKKFNVESHINFFHSLRNSV